jgi:DMSO/TMAO reductase YedYZ molybdopterin-dependent catalytic subunit
MTRNSITRRAALLGAGGLALSGCDQLSQNQTFKKLLESAENLSLGGQRLVLNSSAPLAREYQPSDISRDFKANGTVKPDSADYSRLAMTQFADWRLKIDGLVKKPLSLSLDEIKAMPSRTQITRHDCVEGWSAIGKWTGAPLKDFLTRIGADLTAKYVHFACAEGYSVSIDMPTALHPQTQMTFKFDGATLPTRLGFPMRIRIPTKLGFKNPKYVVGLAVLNNYTGGYWEDKGYNWFSGL